MRDRLEVVLTMVEGVTGIRVGVGVGVGVRVVMLVVDVDVMFEETLGATYPG